MNRTPTAHHQIGDGSRDGGASTLPQQDVCNSALMKVQLSYTLAVDQTSIRTHRQAGARAPKNHDDTVFVQ